MSPPLTPAIVDSRIRKSLTRRHPVDRLSARMTGSDAPVVRAENLYRFYRSADEETMALRDVSLRVRRGEIVAVTGPSGSGKSTLLSCLAGLDEPSGGTVWISDQVMSHRSDRHRAWVRLHHVGVVSQRDNLLDVMTVEANVAFVQRAVRRTAHQSPIDLLDRVGLVHRRDHYPVALSGGERARAAIAVALANTPDLLLADEPTGELDRTTEADFCRLLGELALSGTAVVVASHSPALAAAAHRVLQLRDGREDHAHG